MHTPSLLTLALLASPGSTPTEEPCCRVLELRQYTLHEGQRDVLVSLFEREFVESQEALGMWLVGQFRDAQRPQRFVWLRGFGDMAARKEALAAFYGGPVWKAHRAAANATMQDSSDVLLLRPVEGAGFAAPRAARPAVGEAPREAGLLVATLHFRDVPIDDDFVRFYEREVLQLRRALGAQPVALLQTEPAQNSFPALPVREGVQVLVAFERFESAAAYRAFEARLAGSVRWRDEVAPALRRQLKEAPQVLRLEPTARSLLR